VTPAAKSVLLLKPLDVCSVRVLSYSLTILASANALTATSLTHKASYASRLCLWTMVRDQITVVIIMAMVE
jgi:hypothetical protein